MVAATEEIRNRLDKLIKLLHILYCFLSTVATKTIFGPGRENAFRVDLLRNIILSENNVKIKSVTWFIYMQFASGLSIDMRYSIQWKKEKENIF